MTKVKREKRLTGLHPNVGKTLQFSLSVLQLLKAFVGKTFAIHHTSKKTINFSLPQLLSFTVYIDHNDNLKNFTTIDVVM